MDDQRNNRWKLFLLLRHMHLLTILYLFIRVYPLMLEIKREKAKRIERELRTPRERRRAELMERLIHSGQCHDILRMDPRTFLNFCDLLEDKGGLRPSRQVDTHELVARFLYTVGHNEKHRRTAFFFERGRSTISRDFHKVLRAIIELEDVFLKQPNGSNVPPEVLSEERFYPYFKDCVGAIDCTHVRVKVDPEKATRYRGRKDYPTMNVLAACTFDLKFTYVLVGWEGTASDSRIIKNALTRSYPLIIPQGKYYLVDAGFMTRSTLITPYRGERYHLREYSASNPPRSARELFNLRHASLRNAIEQAFGVLKKRFPIIGSTTEPHYSIDTLKQIILACSITHNYLVDKDLDLALLREVDAEIEDEDSGPPGRPCTRAEVEDSKRGEDLKDEIALRMWSNYRQNDNLDVE